MKFFFHLLPGSQSGLRICSLRLVDITLQQSHTNLSTWRSTRSTDLWASFIFSSIFLFFGVVCTKSKLYSLLEFSAATTSWFRTLINWKISVSPSSWFWTSRTHLFSFFRKTLRITFRKSISIWDQTNCQNASYRFWETTKLVQFSLSQETVVF